MINSTGDAFAVWHGTTGASAPYSSDIFSAKFSAIAGWETPVQIDPDPAAALLTSQLPILSIDGSANALAIWQDTISRNFYITNFNNGTGWSTPTSLTNFLGSPLNYTQVAFYSSGYGIFVWAQSNNAGSSTINMVWAMRYIPGMGWGTPEKISTSTDMARVDSPQLVLTPNHGAIVVWIAKDSNGIFSLYQNQLDANGWSTAVPFETVSGTLNNSLAIAFGTISIGADSVGNAMLVYGCFRFTDANLNGIFAKRYIAGSGWQGTIKFPGTTASDFYNRVTVAPDGRATAIWAEGLTNAARYQASNFVPTTGWDTAVMIDNGVTPKSFPVISTSANGISIVIWQRTDSVSSYSIVSNSYQPGHGWTGQTTIGTNSGTDTYGGYSLATDAAGNSVAVWAFGNNIYASYYH